MPPRRAPLRHRLHRLGHHRAILYAVLAALVGIAIVAVGGGGIRTMAQRWEAVAARYDEEKPKIAGTVARPYGERPEDRRY